MRKRGIRKYYIYIYIYLCVCVCMNGEVDFGLRYDPQVKLNKKINKYTNNNNNNKPFVSKFRVNYGFLTNYIGSANGFFFSSILSI